MANDNCIVIPAAGASTRLGQPKQLVEIEGKSMIRRAVEAALEASPNVLVVVGYEPIAVRNEIAGLEAMTIENSKWKSGIGESISTGVRAALECFPGVKGLMIHLCDTPLVGPEHLSTIISAATVTGTDIVFTRYSDAEGVPAFFGRSFFEQLMLLKGGRGAQKLIDCCETSRKTAVDFEEKYLDVDSPEDLETLIEIFRK